MEHLLSKQFVLKPGVQQNASGDAVLWWGGNLLSEWTR